MFMFAMMFAIILSMILMAVYFLTNYIAYTDQTEKMTPFECGFDPLSSMRSPFSTRFFLLVVLFLIFDVEIALLFPILSLFQTSISWVTTTALLIFLTILLFGMFHEWNEGALDWFST